MATRSSSRSTPRRMEAAPCSGATVTFVAVGTCVVDANQAGNTGYEAATQVQQTFASASPRRGPDVVLHEQRADRRPVERRVGLLGKQLLSDGSHHLDRFHTLRGTERPDRIRVA